MRGDFPQPGKGTGGIGYGTLLRIGPCCGRCGRDAWGDRSPVANRLGSYLYLLNLAHSSLKHLLQILGGGRVLAGKFVDHGERLAFCGCLTLRNFKMPAALAQYSVAPGGGEKVPYSVWLVAVSEPGKTLSAPEVFNS